ncbi:hypothetical protein KJ644_01425 [Candidatus Dependentiae bacterium]|nr:hypothetical protein [Candidatus Dependentiae bacterium]MBU4387112.1 hypothetical protein [Candidatus Dependentiae bacterium]MCG2756508.1 hypothetical protein [Candidatus Dependentiae bacterium]
MNKLLKGLLVTAFAVGTMNAATNKTFLMPRSQGVNLPMEYTTFNELIQHKNGDFFGAHFQVVPFYLESCDKGDLGKYFGFANKNVIRLSGSTNIATSDLAFRRIFHHADEATAVADVKFEPELQAYGARIDYYQDLEKILDGLYLKVALPIVNVDTDMHINVSNKAGGNSFFLSSNYIENYFLGTYGDGNPAATAAAQTGADAQQVLKYAKIGGSHSETSVADIDLVLGYKFFDKEKYYVALNLGLTIPVGNDADGVWAFEPIVGNGGHWAVGGGLDFSVKLWEKNDQNIKLTGVANYRYMFEDTEMRTLGLKKSDGTSVNWGQYRYVGTDGGNTAIPAANVLTKNVEVEPGSQVDAILYFTYNNGGWTLDLGYNFFWKEREDVKLKGTDFQTATHAIVDPDWVGTASLLVTNFLPKASDNAVVDGATFDAPVVFGTTAYQLIRDNIDTTVAETPSMDTHKIFAGVGYNWKEWEYPLMLGIGGAYEFAGNDGIENWQVYGKIGMKF